LEAPTLERMESCPGVGKGGRYPDELRERAVRMVLEHQGEYWSQWKAIVSIAGKLDVHRETLRVWSAGPRSRTVAGRGSRPTSGHV
jgi:transposase